MSRPHESPCECNLCWAADLQDKYPDLLNKYSLVDIGEIWCSYSEGMCAGWIDDDREAVFQVFYQSYKWREEGKLDTYYWRTGRFFKDFLDWETQNEKTRSKTSIS